MGHSNFLINNYKQIITTKNTRHEYFTNPLIKLKEICRYLLRSIHNLMGGYGEGLYRTACERNLQGFLYCQTYHIK